jgi:hypothetical protein
MEQDVTVKIPRTWIKGLPEEGLNKQDLIREARHHNINPEYSEQTIKEELSKWH